MILELKSIFLFKRHKSFNGLFYYLIKNNNKSKKHTIQTDCKISSKKAHRTLRNLGYFSFAKMSDTELWSSVLKNYGLEAEIFYLCSGVLSIWILISVEGDLSRLEGFFATKCCLCFKKSKNVRTYVMLFRIFVTLIVLLPLLLLIAWGTYVFY